MIIPLVCFAKPKPEYLLLRTIHLFNYLTPMNSLAFSSILYICPTSTSHHSRHTTPQTSIRKPITIHLNISTATALLLSSSFNLLNASVLEPRQTPILPVCPSGILVCCHSLLSSSGCNTISAGDTECILNPFPTNTDILTLATVGVPLTTLAQYDACLNAYSNINGVLPGCCMSLVT